MIEDVRKFKQILLFASLLLVIAAMIGCGDENPVNSFNPTVTNVEDTFTFHANNAYVVTETYRYSWNNTGQQASIEQVIARSGGTVTLVIEDADGNQVYSEALAGTENDATDVGNPGPWRVVVDFKEFSGSVFFRLLAL